MHDQLGTTVWQHRLDFAWRRAGGFERPQAFDNRLERRNRWELAEAHGNEGSAGVAFVQASRVGDWLTSQL
jgi:hypothetical protein